MTDTWSWFSHAHLFSELQTLLLGGVMYWGIGRCIHLFVSRHHEERRIHGRWIPEWVGGMTILFGVVFLWRSGPVNVPYPPSLAGFHLGLLAGFVIGWVHGNFALFRFRNPKKLNEVAFQRTNVEDLNPYRPPSIVTIFDRDQ